MASDHRLKLKRKEIEKIIREGKRIWLEDIMLIIYLPNQLGFRRFAVIASKKVGKAVKRNRAKRLLREFFRKNVSLFPESSDFILIASPKILSLRYPELEGRLKPKLVEEFPNVPS